MALTDNLVAYYKFDNGALTTDSVGSYTLTNLNTVAGTASGKIGYGADFGASNTTKCLYNLSDYGITATGAISFSFWVKLNTDVSAGLDAMYLFSRAYTGASGSGLKIFYQYNGGTRRIGTIRYGSGNYIDYYNVNFGTSNWHHIVLTYDGTNIITYYNGSSVISGTNTGTQNFTQSHIIIGSNSTGPEVPASAIFDEVGVWSRALSADEVKQLYNNNEGLTYPLNTPNFKFRPGSLGSML